jgi:hypothetical protein
MLTMTITKTTLPEYSMLSDNNKRYDYVDSFQGTVVDNENKLTSLDISKAFLSSSPQWVGKLFRLRNKIAGLFGLKTAGDINERQKTLYKFKCEPGEQVGLFKVFGKTDNEVVLGEDDKHLDFRVSLLLEKSKDNKVEKRLTISTTVVFNNWFGRVYFLPVRPFHRIIVPAMLKGIIKQLEAKKI